MGTGRYAIRVSGVQAHEFQEFRASLNEAKERANRVANWAKYRGREVYVKDSVPVKRVTDSIFGGVREVIESPVVYKTRISKR